ncbi:MAG: CocE/NonD family hydrolase [Planctomycetes bacterium]|nr:CocE/NonD family hydrolase [Planctomycetota bacterium]
MRTRQLVLAPLLVFLAASVAWADVPKNVKEYVENNYTRKTYKIPVRDGVHLYTIVYSPKDTSKTYPILLNRTPYSIGPYEEDKFMRRIGPNPHFLMEGYIFAHQDVRGRYMSEGVFDNMRPHNPKRTKKTDIDESTDTYDTIDFLVKNVPNNNGKVGLWGISYPGFYSSAGMIDAHPALKAVSPQAPIADWFFDDFYHHGAFFLPHFFHFFAGFGQERPEPTTQGAKRIFEYPTKDGFKLFMDLGSLKHVDDKYYKNKIAYWKTIQEHPTYDEYWQARNLLPHLKNVAPAVMTVGGWYDAEDLYGALNTYQAIEKQNPKIFNVLVMGPWTHGGWAGAQTKLADIHWGSNTSGFFQEQMELPFFNHFLKGKGEHNLPEAYVFETGANAWRKYAQWPPARLEKKTFYMQGGKKLSVEPPQEEQANDAYVSDPKDPVPFTNVKSFGMRQEYMIENQSFASKRPDVLVYQTGVLPKDLTLAGPVQADLYVSTSGSDSDWVVKVIDVFPDDAKDPDGKSLAGYQMHVRSEVIRGRYRNSYSKPEPFTPDQVAKVSLKLQDFLHTFKKGHRMMVQIHSTWFPLVDRNPQKYVPNIFLADDDDFITVTNRVYREKSHPSGIQVGILPATKN